MISNLCYSTVNCNSNYHPLWGALVSARKISIIIKLKNIQLLGSIRALPQPSGDPGGGSSYGGGSQGAPMSGTRLGEGKRGARP